MFSRLKQMKHKKYALLAVILALILAAVIFFQVAVIAQPQDKLFLGFSGYVSSQEALGKTVGIMEHEKMNVYRVSFTPSWTTPQGSDKAYNSTLIDYLLTNTSLFVIVDGNHLYPSTQETAQDASDHWIDVRNRDFQILADFPNDSRVAVELVNEYNSTDYNSRTQQLIDEIRGAGYTNPLVTNKLSTEWVKFSDPLDNTYQGMHFFFNTWTAQGALAQMEMAKSMGITKIVNTEVGASFYEQKNFTQTNVGELELFLSGSQALGISNCVWMNRDASNWQRYTEYGLTTNSEQ